MTVDTIRDRIAGVCEAQPFGLTLAVTPFSFDLQPSGQIDAVFRLEVEGDAVIGGLALTEERTDLVHCWLARKYNGDAETMYTRLLQDAATLRAAVIRDGLVNDYAVPDAGAGLAIQRESGKEFAVLRLTLPVNYEVSLAA